MSAVASLHPLTFLIASLTLHPQSHFTNFTYSPSNPPAHSAIALTSLFLLILMIESLNLNPTPTPRFHLQPEQLSSPQCDCSRLSVPSIVKGLELLT